MEVVSQVEGQLTDLPEDVIVSEVDVLNCSRGFSSTSRKFGFDRL